MPITKPTVKLKKYGSTNYAWWLRSPMVTITLGFCIVTNTGTIDGDMTDEQNGISFAFCL